MNHVLDRLDTAEHQTTVYTVSVIVVKISRERSTKVTKLNKDKTNHQ